MPAADTTVLANKWMKLHLLALGGDLVSWFCKLVYGECRGIERDEVEGGIDHVLCCRLDVNQAQAASLKSSIVFLEK